MGRIFLVPFSAALLVLLTSCASKPEQELDAARQALETARSAEAEVYAPSKFRKAVDTLESAETEVTVQDGKFALSRNYDKATELLDLALSEAQTAAEAAPINKVKVRTRAEAAVGETQEAVEKARSMLRKAPRRGKGSRENVAALEADVASAEAMLAGAQQVIAAGQYHEALSQMDAVKSKANGVSSEIEQAIQKRRRR